MIVTSTFQLGPYTVRIALRDDNPAFPRFMVFRGEKHVGNSFSRPAEGCCQWLEQHQEGRYAPPSLTPLPIFTKRRGRPRKVDAERELLEAMST